MMRYFGMDEEAFFDLTHLDINFLMEYPKNTVNVLFRTF